MTTSTEDCPSPEPPEVDGGAEQRTPRAEPHSGPPDPTRARRRHRRVTRAATNADADPAEGQTNDDIGAAWGEGDEGSDRDRWLREQRPPHWG